MELLSKINDNICTLSILLNKQKHESIVSHLSNASTAISAKKAKIISLSAYVSDSGRLHLLSAQGGGGLRSLENPGEGVIKLLGNPGEGVEKSFGNPGERVITLLGNPGAGVIKSSVTKWLAHLPRSQVQISVRTFSMRL